MSTQSVKYVVTADTKNAQKGMENLKKGILENEQVLRNIRNVSAVAFTAVTAGIIATTKKASDLGESINAVDVVFWEGADKILAFGKTAADAVGLSARAFNELSTETGTLLKATGKPIDEVAESTIALTKRAADLASVFNVDVDVAMSALNQALRGEGEAIRKFGSDVTDASLQQFAIAEGIEKAVSQMTQQEKTLLRQQKIMADTSQVQDDFINTSDSLANQQRSLASNVENISATIGTLFIPILEDLTGIVAGVASKIGDFATKYPKLTKVIVLATFAITGIIAVITTLILAMPILTAVTSAFGIAVTIATSPVTLIILAIVALIAIIVLLVKHWDVVKKFTIESWEKIKEATLKATESMVAFLSEKWGQFKDWFLGLMEGISRGILSIWNSIKQFFIDLWVSIKQGALNWLQLLQDFITTKFNDIKDGIMGIWDGIQQGVSGIFSGIMDFAGQQIDNLKTKLGSARDVALEIASLGFAKTETFNGNDIEARASGGPVNRNQPYLVGEEGPELFVPWSSGNIKTAGETAGMWGINVSINLGGVSVQNNQDIDTLANRISQVMQRDLENNKFWIA